MSEHLAHCMDQLVHLSAVTWDSSRGFEPGGEVAELKLEWLQHIHTSPDACGTPHLV